MLYHVPMPTQRVRLYVAFRSTLWERPYVALGTVVAPTHSAAQAIARCRWRVDLLAMPLHIRAAGSVSASLLRAARAQDGEYCANRGVPNPSRNGSLAGGTADQARLASGALLGVGRSASDG